MRKNANETFLRILKHCEIVGCPWLSDVTSLKNVSRAIAANIGMFKPKMTASKMSFYHWFANPLALLCDKFAKVMEKFKDSFIYFNKKAESQQIWLNNWPKKGETSKKRSQQHPVFPGGHPSKYWLDSTLLNFTEVFVPFQELNSIINPWYHGFKNQQY